MFINYDSISGVTINSFCKPAGELTDMDGLLDAIAAERPASCSMLDAFLTETAQSLQDNESEEAQSVKAAIELFQQQEMLAD